MSKVPEFETACRQMIDAHLKGRDITSTTVLDAMARVPRERFVPAGFQHQAYADRALGISCGQTISQPYMVALMTQVLDLSGGSHVLEVGTGSGYQTAVLAELAGDVVSIERHAELSADAGTLLADLGYTHVRLVVGDGTRGHVQSAPYDRIMVTAAAAECPPALVDQLVEGGILVIPVGAGESQILQAVRKTPGGLQSKSYTACRFVPLIPS